MKNSQTGARKIVCAVTLFAIALNATGCGMLASQQLHGASSVRMLGDEDGEDRETTSREAVEDPHESERSASEITVNDRSEGSLGASEYKGSDGVRHVDFSFEGAGEDTKVTAPEAGIQVNPVQSVESGNTPTSQGGGFTAHEGSSGLHLPKSDGSAGPASASLGGAPKSYPNLQSFKDDVAKDRADLESSISDINARLRVTASGLDAAVHVDTVNYNTAVDSILAGAPGWQGLVSGSSKSLSLKSSDATAVGQSIRLTMRAIEYTRSTGNASGESAGLLSLATETLGTADVLAAGGDLNAASGAELAAEDLMNAARYPSSIPVASNAPENLEGALSEADERGYSYVSAKRLYSSANVLDAKGLKSVAAQTRVAAGTLLNIALGLARFSNIVNLSMSVMEAFSGQTVDFDAAGNPRIRQTSKVERAFGIGAVTIAAAGFAAGGWAAAMSLGIVAGISEAVEKQLAIESGELAAKALAAAEMQEAEKVVSEFHGAPWSESGKVFHAYAKLQNAIESLPAGIKVQRIRVGGDIEKVAIVGRSMGNAEKGLVGVNDAAAHFRSSGIEAETFQPSVEAWKEFTQSIDEFQKSSGKQGMMLPDEKVLKTKLFKENALWAQKIKDNGYIILDVGNPNNLSSESPFYEIEKKIIF